MKNLQEFLKVARDPPDVEALLKKMHDFADKGKELIGKV
jgi:hypothetical protein